MESVDRRILGAFRCVDAVTQNAIPDPLPVRSGDLLLRANRLAIYVVFLAPKMLNLTEHFLPPGVWPAPLPFEVTIQDPRLRYLPRRAQVRLPRALTPYTDPQSVLQPQSIPLYPSPAAPVAPNWAVIRASVRKKSAVPPQGLPWTVLQVTRDSDSAVLATGMTDPNGEALLAIPGLSRQVSQSGGGAVMQPSVTVTIRAYFDATTLQQPDSWVPNPDDILGTLTDAKWKTATQPAQISAGQTLTATLEITV